MQRFLYIFTLFLYSTLWGQKEVELTIVGESYKQIKKNYTRKFKDTVAAMNYVQSYVLLAQKQGYLLASFDSVSITQKHVYAYLHVGEKWKDAILTMDPIEMKFVQRKTSLSERFLAHTAISPVEFSQTLQRIQRAYVNEGYPFAAIHLDSIRYTPTQLYATVVVNRGPEMKWQKIHIRGDSTLSEKYVSNLIGIRIGDRYSEKELKSVSNRLQQVNFLNELKPAEVLYSAEGCELFLYLEARPISSINGVLGLQQNPITDRLSFTGEVNLNLLNVLNRGEQLKLDWRSIQAQTQALNAYLSYPFLFKTSFGIDGRFNLYKRDTTFLELKSSVGVNYFLKGGNYIKGFYRNASSNLLGQTATSTTQNLASVSSNSYGLSLYRRQLDYVPNPSRGLVFEIEGSIGTRKSRITDTSEINSSTIYTISADVNYFIPLSRRHVIRLRTAFNTYYTPVIFQNELYRYGGLNTLRGFNEEELFASTAALASVEYRFLVDRNSHFFAFFDQSIYENRANDYFSDAPYGFGVGFSFGTNIGIFSISYALGSQFDNPILLRNGKVHFGYVAYF